MGFALALGLRLGLGLVLALRGLGGGGGGGLFVATLEVAGFFLGGLGGGFGGLGGGALPPLVLLLLLLVSPARSGNLTQPLRCGSMPPTLLPDSHLPKPTNTERATFGSVPIIRPNSVTPTRRVRPPASRHSTRTPRGSAAHVCTLPT